MIKFGTTDGTCFQCRFWENAQIGMKLQSGGRDGFRFGERYYEAIGVGHCEHPDKPRGLTLCVYTCPAYTDKSAALTDETATEVKDVTPLRKAIR